MSFLDISWDKKHNKMESHVKKQGRFSSTLKTYVSKLFQIKGTIREKRTSINVSKRSLTEKNKEDFQVV